MTRRRKQTGGATVPHNPALRAEATKLALRIGASRAAQQLGLKPGTVRSWCRREVLRQLKEREQGEESDALKELQRVGAEMLREREAREAAAAQRGRVGASDQGGPASATAGTEAHPSLEPEPPKLTPHLVELGRRRHATQKFDAAFPEEAPQPPRVPAPEEREPSEEEQWRKLAEMTGNWSGFSSVVDDGVVERDRRRRGGPR